MSYVAPELLSGGTYSKATDVYAFGMIMWEVNSGRRPFLEIPHNYQLAIRICKGDRPEISESTPQFYHDLMKKCWDSDPTKRPNAQEIHDVTASWRFEPTQEVTNQIVEAEKIRQCNTNTK